MTYRPEHINGFEFARVAALRAAQLMRGCIARVERGSKHTVTARREVAEYFVQRNPPAPRINKTS